jgi:hypothetical protein
LAASIVRPGFRAGILVEIEAEPRFDDGVDIKRAEITAKLHDIERRGINREIDAKALAFALRQQRLEQLDIVVARHSLLDEAQATLLDDLAVGVEGMGIDDNKAALVEGKMTLD